MGMKKLTAALCAAVMMGTSVPAMAVTMPVCAEEEAVVTSGTFKGNQKATWELNTEDGTLTIGGRGEALFKPASLLSANNEAPWSHLCGDIKRVVIEEGITGIPYCAFNGCTKIEEYVVSENNKYYSSVNGVLYNKSQDCLIRYPANAAATEYKAEALKSPGPGEAVTVFHYAFMDAQNLITVVLPKDLTNVQDYPFSNSSVERIFFLGNGAPVYHILFRTNTKIPKDVILYGLKNSSVQDYAKKNEKKKEYAYQFVEIDENGNILGVDPWTPRETTERTTDPVPAAAIPGDLDGSGAVDIMDVIKLNKAVLGTETLTDEKRKLADINKDGKADSEDALLLLKLALEIPIA